MYRSHRRASAILYPLAWFGLGLVVGVLGLILIFGPPWQRPAGTDGRATPSAQTMAGDEEPTLAPTLTPTRDSGLPSTLPSTAPVNVPVVSGGPTTASGASAAPTGAPATSAPATPAPTTAPATATPTLEPRQAIEALVVDLMERFQEAKEESQRTGEATGLDAIMAGEALEKRTALAAQTKAAGCTWDISLDEPMTYEFLEVRDDYVRVRVSKVESRTYYCGGVVSGENIQGDRYDTVYVVERLPQGWRVTRWE